MQALPQSNLFGVTLLGGVVKQSRKAHTSHIGPPWLGVQGSILICAIGNAISSPAHPIHLDAGFSISGWLAVLLTFVLAGVFANGTRMQEDLQGTV
jgi:hypothetical protein